MNAIIQSSSHPVIQSSSHPVIQSSSHPVIQSSSHPVIQSSSHPVIQSSSHPVIQSSSHPVIQSSSHSDQVVMSTTAIYSVTRVCANYVFIMCLLCVYGTIAVLHLEKVFFVTYVRTQYKIDATTVATCVGNCNCSTDLPFALSTKPRDLNQKHDITSQELSEAVVLKTRKYNSSSTTASL